MCTADILGPYFTICLFSHLNKFVWSPDCSCSLNCWTVQKWWQLWNQGPSCNSCSLGHYVDRPQPTTSSPLQQTVKNQSSQATKPDHTCTHCPHSGNSFCLLRNKKGRLERSQHRGTIHWGSEKSLTEAIYFPSQRESLFFTLAPLHSASCRNCTTLRYWAGNECNSGLTLFMMAFLI